MKKSLRLNLGCGGDKKMGFVNVDINKEVRPYVVADLGKRFPFGDGVASKILAYDVLEHLTREEGRKFLGECFRVMGARGDIRLRVAFPQRIIENFSDDEEVRNLFLYGDTSKVGNWGVHKCGYSKRELITETRLAGFDDIVISEEETNLMVRARKGRVVNLSKITVIMQDAVAMGGAEFLMLNLVKEWQKGGVAAYVFTILRELIGRLKVESLSASYIPFRMDVIGGWKGAVKFFFYLPVAILFYFDLLNRGKKRSSQLVLVTGFTEKILVTPLAFILGFPVVWIEFGPLAPVFCRNLFLPKLLYRLVKDIPEKVITLSENTKRSLVVDARISEAKIKVLPGGVEVFSEEELVRLRNEGKKLRRSLRLGDKVVVGYLSRVASEKRQVDLVETFVKTDASFGKAVLVIAGEGPDLGEVKKKVKELKAEKSVKVLGWVEDKWIFYGMLDFFVFASDWDMEGFGLVMAEAMMAGVPVVGVDSGPVGEVVVDGETGFVVKKSQLGEVIDRMVESESLRRRLGSAAREVAMRRFSLPVLADKFKGQLVEALVKHEVEKLSD